MGPNPCTAADGARKSETGKQSWALTGDTDDITVSVAWKQVEFFQVTMEVKEQMTHKEYRHFFEAQHSAGDDEGDDDGHFSDQDKEQRA